MLLGGKLSRDDKPQVNIIIIIRFSFSPLLQIKHEIKKKLTH